MNSFVDTKDASPSGEESSCLQLANMTLNIETIELTLLKILGIPQNKVGLLSCACALGRDFKACVHLDDASLQWKEAFSQLKLSLESDQTESLDKILSGTKSSIQSKLLLAEFGEHLTKDAKLKLRQIRVKVVLHHVSRKQPIPEKFARLFADLITGKSPKLHLIGNSLTLESKELILLRKMYEPASDVAEFLTSLLSALDTPTVPPPILTAQQIAPIVSTSYESNIETHLESSEASGSLGNGSEQEVNQDVTNQDVIGNLLYETEHARPRDFSGICNLWDFLQPSELELAVGTFSKDLEGEFYQESLASLLAISTRTRPKHYGSIPLIETEGKSLWIDLTTGHIVWWMDAVIDRKSWQKGSGACSNLNPVRIPLPADVSKQLCKLLSKNPTSTNLGELFGGHLDALEISTKKYLKRVSTTNHRLTLGRLQSSLARYILELCKDEAYSGLLGIDFRIGTPSNFNYCSFRAGRINSILCDAYSRLGLSGLIESPISRDVGSRFLGSMVNIDMILKESLQDAVSTYEQVKRKLDASSLAVAHTTISTSILRAMCITTGHRESDNYSFANHTIDLETCLALISDKVVSPYHHTRLVPIPEVMGKWMRFYNEWLAHLRYRYLSLDLEVAKYIDSILTGDKRADGEMFFALSTNGKIRGLRNADISQSFKNVGLEANAGRHWCEHILREDNQDSAVIMAWAGHSAIGQEAYGHRSALDPTTVCDAVRLSLNNHLGSLELQYPPPLKSRMSEKPFNHQHKFVPGRFEKTYNDVIVNMMSLEKCPFDEMTLVLSRQFIRAAQMWLSHNLEKSLGSVAMSLIISDGIYNRSELIGSTTEAIWGKIYQDSETYFLDSSTNELGIRRAWLSPTSVALSAQIEIPKPTHSTVASVITDAARDILRLAQIEWQDCPLDHLLEMARGYYSLRLPGALRGWMDSSIHSRTLRPETIARHKYNCVEHPRIEKSVGRVSRRDTSDKFITELILREADTTQYRGREKTRLQKLQKDLQEFEDVAMDSGVLEIKLRYAIYLTKAVDSPSTVKRYFYALRNFIEDTCQLIESMDDLAEIEWEAPVNSFRDVRIAASPSDNGSDPALAALNHFLRCIGVELFGLKRADPAAAARRYADYPSRKEVLRAAERLPELSPLPQPRTAQAVLALKTMAARSLRWFEVSRLRTSDVTCPEQSSLVITHEAVGTHKSSNSDRIHCLIENELSSALSNLATVRSELCRSDPDAFLFANKNDYHSVSQSDELRRQISDALWASTGSDSISPHCTRRLEPTEQFEYYLSPDSRNSKSPLALRQFMYSLAGSIGHGDPLTTVSHYLTRLDEVRLSWVTHLLELSGIRPSFKHTASIVGIPADTLRARDRRNSKLTQKNILADFDFGLYPKFLERVRKLNELIVEGTNILNIEPREPELDDSRACSIYVAARLLGNDEELASFVSNIDIAYKETIDRGLSVFKSGLGKNWNSTLQIKILSLADDELLLQLTEQLRMLKINTTTAIALSKSIMQPDSAWIISNVEDASSIHKVVDQIDKRLVTAVISRSKNPSSDSRAFTTFHDERYLHRKLDSRWFPRGCMLRVQFIPADGTIESLPATTPSTTFLISAILISKCALTLGASNE